MVPTGSNDKVSTTDPPFTVTGMRSLLLDTEGRLIEFHAVPPQLEQPSSGPPSRAVWTPLFALADLKPGDFKPVEPRWTPRSYADERTAWEGPMAGWPDQTLRVEAAAHHGRITLFQSVNPWTQPGRMQETAVSRTQQIIQSPIAVTVLVVLTVRSWWPATTCEKDAATNVAPSASRW